MLLQALSIKETNLLGVMLLQALYQFKKSSWSNVTSGIRYPRIIQFEKQYSGVMLLPHIIDAHFQFGVMLLQWVLLGVMLHILYKAFLLGITSL